jgi:hypothetical protein
MHITAGLKSTALPFELLVKHGLCYDAACKSFVKQCMAFVFSLNALFYPLRNRAFLSLLCRFILQ